MAVRFKNCQFLVSSVGQSVYTDGIVLMTVNHEVVGSIPTRGALYFSNSF
jgi:hypothetical protein